MQVFYCDDDSDYIEFFTEVISRIDSNIQVTTCSDPEEALELLSQMKRKPDFLFFDASMSKLDGLECTIAAKRNNSLKKIPFAILSGGLDSSQIAAYNKLGVHTFFSKTTLDDLEQSLRSLLTPQ
jgi:CheY-like chemotaxis protein